MQTKAFGGKRGGSHWRRLKENPHGAYLPIFLSAGNIKPFIDNELSASLGRRRIYRPKKGGAAAYGVEATLLPKICNVYLTMRDDSKKPLTANKAEFDRAFARAFHRAGTQFELLDDDPT